MCKKIFSEQDFKTARYQIQQTLKIYPKLNSNGMPLGRLTFEPEELLEDLVLMQFLLCKEWIQQCKIIKTVNQKHSSYGYKHYVERWSGCYICNGAFIAAGITLDLPLKIYSDSPNVLFGISEKSIKLMDKAKRPYPPEPSELFCPGSGY